MKFLENFFRIILVKWDWYQYRIWAIPSWSSKMPHLFRLNLFLALFVLSSCVMVPVELGNNSAKKKVNVPMRPESDRPRARTLVLPIQDSSEWFERSSLQEIYDNWLNYLEKQDQLILIKPEEIELNLQPPLNYLAIAQKAHDAGIQLVIAPTIQELKFSQQVAPIGVIRSQTIEMMVRVNMEVYQSKNGQKLLNKSRLITQTDRRRRLGNDPEKIELSERKKLVLEFFKLPVEEVLMDFYLDIVGLFDRFQWEGRIAKIQGDRIFLNVGRKTGLKVGDLLRVTDLGEEIYDPQSGQFIGRSSGRVKGTIEIIGFFGEDGGVAVLHSGAGFKENDRVELSW